MTARPCLDCGEVIHDTHCQTCTPRHGTARQRGYTSKWDRLSRRARRLSPLCEDCGTTQDLQADHTPQAWQRQAAGKPIRLTDIAVVCGTCNRKRGPARGPNQTRGPTPTPPPPRTPAGGKPVTHDNGSHLGGRYGR